MAGAAKITIAEVEELSTCWNIRPKPNSYPWNHDQPHLSKEKNLKKELNNVL